MQNERFKQRQPAAFMSDGEYSESNVPMGMRQRLYEDE
jgi:hypothetical protein